MAAEPMEVRMARLEGAYEQINVRLAGLEREITALRGDMGSLRGDVSSQFAEMRRRTDAQFYWLLTLVLGSILVPILRDLTVR
jgi:hypothetical protein